MPLENDTLLYQVEDILNGLGVWNEHIVIAGGVALVIYDCCLIKKSMGAVGTTDVDFLINRKQNIDPQISISDYLDKLGFTVRHKDLNTPSIQSYVKTVENTEIEVEFLTDAKSRINANAVVIEKAGITAQPLSFIEMSLKEYISVKLPRNAIARIVSPEAWVYHKGLTFAKRTKVAKKYKDLYGIWFVLAHIQSKSVSVMKNLHDLQNRYPPSWKKTFESNLVDWIKAATPKDWRLLEQQDQLGRLSKEDFRLLISQLMSG